MRLVAKGPEETINAGRELGKTLTAGRTVCLYGDLGAGKTTFTKGIARGLGIDEREIMSASFIIISEHRGKTANTPLYHIDLYRLEKGYIDETGVYDYIGSDGVAVIEWAEKIELEDCIKVRINMLTEQSREIIIEDR